jgi:glutamate-1-semialdehyde aminotransferase/malonyl CoA-acyl carrier protein transacylase/acyl carrier protein
MAGVAPSTISYIEAHGTGTPLGDPIEVAALTKVFRGATNRTSFCAIGTAKGNVGHLDSAAGVTGVIKTTLSMQHRTLPGLAHFERPNPNLDLNESPFRFTAQTAPWTAAGPLRAGVSAFGVGGVNAHIVMEEAPLQHGSKSPRSQQVLCVSGRTEAAALKAASNLAAHFAAHPDTVLADAAFTLASGRKPHQYRLAIAAADIAQAQSKLANARAHRAATPKVAFLFSGQGTQFTGMGKDLYDSEPVYRAVVDDAAAALKPTLGLDLRTLMFAAADDSASASKLERTEFAQPAIFVTELALLELWQSWGVEPTSMTGHSLGEYVAATLAGVFSRADALRLVALRGRLMQQMQPGAMISIPLDEAALEQYVTVDVCIAALNSPRASVLSGPVAAIDALEARLQGEGIASRRLRTSHGFHSATMEPMLAAFEDEVAKLALHAPSRPFVSSVTGTWITTEQATSARYWAQHCRKPVRFRDALECLLHDGADLLLEAGPGKTLTTLAMQSPAVRGVVAIASFTQSETIQHALASAWSAGAKIDWDAVHSEERRLRVSLPTYPFERKLHWVEPPARELPSPAAPDESTVAAEVEPCQECAAQAEAPARRFRLRAEIGRVFSELSGIETTPDEAEHQFLELGFDSLFLTQATQSLQKKFGVKLTFRQLMEQLSTIASLADYLDSVLPPDAFAATPAAPVAPKASVATAAQAEVRFFRPAQAKAPQEVTQQQQRYIDGLIAKYAAKTPGSKRLTQQGRAQLADPRAVAGFRPQWKEMVYPLITERALGSRLWDVDGNEYIDIVNGYGCIMFGHSPSFVVDAVRDQLERGVAIGPQTPLASEVAALICELTGNERVTFCNTGSEAVMAAIRVARTVTGRDKLVYFTGDYHGTFDEVLIRNTPRGSAPVAPGIPLANVTNVVVLEYGSDQSLEYLRTHADEIAAVLIEPVQTRHPEVKPFAFIRAVRALTEQTGSAMILDEVVTGFRLAPGGVQEYLGIRADMCTYGKVIGGGHPIGVLSGKALYLDALDGGAWQYGDDSGPEVGVTFFAGTFVRHPLALAAARSVLKHLQQAGPELQRTLNAKTAKLAESLDRFFVERGVPSRIHHFASWFYFTFAGDARFASLFYYAMRARGIHIQEGYPCFLTTAHTKPSLRCRTPQCCRARSQSTILRASFCIPRPSRHRLRKCL